MSALRAAGIYLFVEFEWAKPFQAEFGVKARALHTAVQEAGWIREVATASGGVGGGASSVWVFWLENYAALDRLLRSQEDAIGQAYRAFFAEMVMVTERVREEIQFQ